MILGRLAQLVDGERRRGDDEQRLDRVRETVDRVRCDQAERSFHSWILSSSERETLIGREWLCLAQSDLAGLAQLEEREERHGLLDAGEPLDLGVEVEDAPAAEQRTEAFEELRHRREAKRHVAERHGRWRDRERTQRRAERFGILRRKATLDAWRQRSRPDAEPAILLGAEALDEPGGSLLHAPVLREPSGELLRGLLWLELTELGGLVGEQRARLELEQRRHEDEELTARLQIEFVTLREALDEREDDGSDVDLPRLELLLQEQRQEEVERPFEGIELELELADGHRLHAQEASHAAGRVSAATRRATRPLRE